MGGEVNQVRWVGVRPTDPPEDIPVKVSSQAVDMEVVQPNAGDLNVTVVPKKAGAGSYGQVSVGNTATKIVASNTSRIAVVVKNHGSTAVYVGFDSSVTTANGIQLLKGDSLEITVYTGDIYGIVASGNETVGYLEV